MSDVIEVVSGPVPVIEVVASSVVSVVEVVTGPAGPPGAGGGVAIHAAAGAPTAAVGDAGDFYLDTATGTLYGPKADAAVDEFVDIAPPFVAGGLGTNLTLGMYYRFSVDGVVTGIRFYSGTPIGTVANYRVHLWSKAGTRLATATPAALVTGYNDVRFAAPVAVAANTTYVASFMTVADGQFPYKDGDFPGQTSGHVRALAEGEDGPQGFYGIGDAFPSLSWASYPGVSPLFAQVVGWPVAIDGRVASVMLDGVPAPVPVIGRAMIYVDAADGDLKVIFGDGVVKTLAADT
jgi:hypothetical protein